MTRTSPASGAVASGGPKAWVVVLAVGVAVGLVSSPGLAQDAAPGDSLPARPSRDGTTVLDVPFLPQSELLCGGAAAAMVLRYWGGTGVFPEDFEPLVRPSEGGIRAGELAEEIRRRGWRAVSFRGSGPEVRGHVEVGRPVIALIEVGPDRYHFVVVVAWSDEGVVYHDPAVAPFQTASPGEFREAWSPTDRWSLLVLPSADAAVPPRGDERVPGAGEASDRNGDDRAVEAGVADDSAGDEFPGEASCAPVVEEAVGLARSGEVGRAEEMLRDAVRQCPTSARARAELAGLHAGGEAWERAAQLSEEALDLDPSLSYAWRILATSRYLLGDRVGALAAWNRVDEPEIERIRIQGLERTRYAEVQRRTGLSLDRLLTPDRFRLASRRLGLLPSAEETALRYRPREDGRVEVIGTVVQRPLFPTSALSWGGIAMKGALARRAVVSSASVFGAGELWTVEGRWEENRPALFLEVELPEVPLVPGVTSLRAGWERQTYRVVPGGEDEWVREERRTARVSSTDWWTGRFRWEVTGGLDRWTGRPGPASTGLPVPGEGSLDAVLAAGLELRTLDDELSVRLEGGGARRLSESPERSYLDGEVAFRWRSSDTREGVVVHLRGRTRGVTDGAPLATWPGAGDGLARDGLLRSHGLLDDGVISGEAFGRILADGGVEARWWTSWVPAASVGLAGFVDAARPWRTLGTGAGQGGRFLAGAGAGVRVALPGRSGTGRADLARDLRDGGWRFHVAWAEPWPDP